MKRWAIAGVLALTSLGWLLWAFPRFHPAAQWKFVYDRHGFADAAAQFAKQHGVDADRWKSYAVATIGTDEAILRRERPWDTIGRTFPVAWARIGLMAPDDSSPVDVTFRPDGTPLHWKLPAPKTNSGTSADKAAAAALAQAAGADAPNYKLVSTPIPNQAEERYTWERGGKPEESHAKIVAVVENGVVRELENTRTIGDGLETGTSSAVTIVFGVAWGVIAVIAVVTILIREGRHIVRAMGERSMLYIAAVAAAGFIAATLFGLGVDHAVFATQVHSGRVSRAAWGLVVAGMFMGMFWYFLLEVALLSARPHAERFRSLALLGTRGAFSRPVGDSLLGGLLGAPVLAAIPLLGSAWFGAPIVRHVDSDQVFSRVPELSVFSFLINPNVLLLFGVVVPLLIQLFPARWLRYGLMGVAAIAMAEGPFAVFRHAVAADQTATVLGVAALFWMYSQFGLLGVLAGECIAEPVTSIATLGVQPSDGLHALAVRILAVLGLIGAYAVVAVWKRREPEVEIYGLAGVRRPIRSRREELRAEFQVARSAQQRMLPSTPPAWPGYSLAVSCEPAREVGGDLYDFLRLRDGRWGIGVADVSGKGVPAALYMTLTKGLLAAASQDSTDPREILISVNKHLHTAAKRKVFVTMALGVLDPENRVLEYARAGHNPIVWRRAAAKETKLLAPAGIGLGITGGTVFQKTMVTEQVALEPGDALVFYSDGLTEAMNDRLEQFGEERLMDVVSRSDGMPAEQTKRGILDEVKRFLGGLPAQDDLTIAVLRVELDGAAVNSNGR